MFTCLGLFHALSINTSLHQNYGCFQDYYEHLNSSQVPSYAGTRGTTWHACQATRVEGYNALGGTTRCGGDPAKVSAAEASPEAPTKARNVAAAQRPALNLGFDGWWIDDVGWCHL